MSGFSSVFPIRYGLLILMLGIFPLSLLSAAELRISNLQDVDFGTVGPNINRLQQHIRICVNSSPAGPYQLTALGIGEGGEFVLTSGSGSPVGIPFSVNASAPGRGKSIVLVPGVPITGYMANEPRRDGGCSPPFSFLIVEVEPQDARQAPGGTYSGSLYLTVAPE